MNSGQEQILIKEMEESNGKELIRVIKNIEEITKDYFIHETQTRGLINLDMNDFRKFADKHKLVMEIIVDARIPVSAQMEAAMEEIKQQGITMVSAIIMSVSFNSSYPLSMAEYGSVRDCLNNLMKQDVEVIWGIQERADISNQRSISLFVFV